MSWISTNNLRRFADNLFHGKLSFNGNVTHNGAVEFNGGVKVNTVEAEFNAPVFFTGPAMYKGNEVATKADVAANSITADDALSSTSTNAIQNRVVQQEFTSVRSAIPTKVSQLTNDSSYTTTNYVRSAVASARSSIEAKIPTKISQLTNDSGYLTKHQSLDGYVKTSEQNTWSAAQTFVITKHNTEFAVTLDGNITPTTSSIYGFVDSNITLDLNTIAAQVAENETMIFRAYLLCSSDSQYTLTVKSPASTLLYAGDPVDYAISKFGTILTAYIIKGIGSSQPLIFLSTSKLGL